MLGINVCVIWDGLGVLDTGQPWSWPTGFQLTSIGLVIAITNKLKNIQGDKLKVVVY